MFKNFTTVSYSENDRYDSPCSANQSQDTNYQDRHDYDYRCDLSEKRKKDNSALKRFFRNQSKEYTNREEKKKVKRDSPTSQNLQENAPFTPFSYNAIDNSSIDYMKHTTSGVPECSIVPSMNTPWNINPIDGMGVNQDSMQMNQSPGVVPASAGLKISPTSSSSLNSYAFVTMTTGENMYSVPGMGSSFQNGMMPSQEKIFFPPVKEVVYLKKSVLYPPNSDAPRPTTRERPLGCKTVFVGGLPEKATEEIIKEIFDLCGTVVSVRMSKKNYCHVRFSDEMFVDNAIYFSGYRLKIENKDETSYTGRLLVDFSRARDDQYEYECKMRPLRRQVRRQEEDYCRPVTPHVNNFSEHQVSLICDRLKNEESFSDAANILITWLERGECSKKNAGYFYSMIQSTDNLVRMLHANKIKCKEQFYEAKKKLNKQSEHITNQFNDVRKIYIAASLQKCWDHFTKAQRKNIETWKKQIEQHYLEVIKERKDKELCEDNFSGRLHLDFAQVRDDQYEYDCKMGALQGQAHHQEEDYCKPVTPPFINFSELEVSSICDKFKFEVFFSEAADILINWLKSGECSKENASSFYWMIQSSTYNLFRMLYANKIEYQEQLNEHEKKLKEQLEQITHQFTVIRKIYLAACLQKCWDHFTKAQRKNIDTWKRQFEEHYEEVINEQEDQEKELGEDESKENYKNSEEELQDENALLKSQLEEAQIKIVMIQSEHEKELKCMDSQLEEAQNKIVTIRQNLKKN